jgi:hypothetical protein
VFVQMFDVALSSWVGGPPGVCIFSETCGNALTVEHTGDVYSCDHFVEPRYLLGNIRDTHLLAMVASGARARPIALPPRLTPEERLAHEAFIASLGDEALWRPVLFALAG